MPQKKQNSSSPRILTLDIETAPMKGFFWRLGEQNVTLDQVDEEWSILSYCGKWLGDKKLVYADTGGRGRAKVRDDSRLLTALHAMLDEADIVVAQNGQKFDVRKINARLIMEGYKPYSPIRVVDTYIETRKIADFTSHKLAWMSKHLARTEKDDHREFPGLELWKECLKDNPKAWAVMRKYNPIDVLATEEVYLHIQGWIKGHPNVAAYSGRPACNNCGSTNLKPNGNAYTQQGRYQRYRCLDCGSYPRGKQNLLSKEARAGLKVN